MGVLEKFLILFESDADDVNKDIKKLDKSLDDTEQSAVGATKASDGASKQFVSMGAKALSAVGGIVAVTSAITGLISTAARIDELGKFADLIGENLEDIDAWGGAVVRAGGSADGFRGSIKSLNEKMVDASVKGFNEITPFFNQLGISIVDVNGKVKSTIDILPELASSFDRIGKQKALGIGQKLGLDTGTIALLQQGSSAVDKLIERQKKLGLVSNEASMISAEFNDIMADFKQVSDFTSQSLLINLVPAITWTIDKLVDLSIWARENKPIVYGFFIGLAAVAVPSLISLAAAGWVAVAPLLIMAAPFIGIAAAAGIAGTAISLIVEDIMGFVDGQDSLLADIAKKWPIVGEVVREIVDDVKIFVEMMKDFAGFLFNVFAAPEKALKSFKNAFGNVKDFFSLDKAKSFFGFDDDEINKNIEIGQGSIALVASHPLSSQTSSSIQNNSRSLSRSTSVQTGDIIVQTQATDAQGIAAGVGGSLQEEMRTTVENFDDGIEI